jgi:hypothetical protein
MTDKRSTRTREVFVQVSGSHAPGGSTSLSQRPVAFRPRQPAGTKLGRPGSPPVNTTELARWEARAAAGPYRKGALATPRSPN